MFLNTVDRLSTNKADLIIIYKDICVKILTCPILVENATTLYSRRVPDILISYNGYIKRGLLFVLCTDYGGLLRTSKLSVAAAALPLLPVSLSHATSFLPLPFDPSPRVSEV